MGVVYWIRAKHHTDMFSEGYIGVSRREVSKRVRRHYADAKAGSTYPVHRAIRKYKDAIVIQVLIEADEGYCYDMEYRLRPTEKIGWNLLVGGSSRIGKDNPFFGKTHSDEVKEAQRIRRTGAITSQETKDKLSQAHSGENNAYFGKKHSEEVRAKISQAAIRNSDKARQRLLGNNPMRGKKHTQESKDKIVATKTANGTLSGPSYWKGVSTWLHPMSNKRVWLAADYLHDCFLLGANTRTRMSKFIGVKLNSLIVIIKKFKEGWIPLEDCDWLDFKQEYLRKLNGEEKTSS